MAYRSPAPPLPNTATSESVECSARMNMGPGDPFEGYHSSPQRDAAGGQPR